jgi:hypothetical protein
LPGGLWPVASLASLAARALALFAALDPYVKITVIDGKRSPDWLPLRYVAHRYVRGTHPDKHGDPVLLTGEDGRQPSPWTIKRAMRRVRTKAKNLPAGFWGCMPAGAVDAAD